MRNAQLVSALFLVVAACSADLPHDAPFDPNAPLEKQAKGQIVGRVTLENESDHSQVAVQLQNAARTYSVQTEADGAVALTGVVPGDYTLKVGTRYFEHVTETVTVKLGERLDLGARLLAARRTGVFGRALLEDKNGDRAGGVAVTLTRIASLRSAASAPVFLPAAAAVTATGITFSAQSDASGAYRLSGVPSGVYSLVASEPGAGLVTIPKVTVTGEDGDVEVKEAVIQPMFGFLEILGKVNGAVTTPTVTLHFDATGFPASIEVAFDPGFISALPVMSYIQTITIDLPAGDGLKAVYVRYFDIDGNESSTGGDTVTLDTTPPQPVSFAIANTSPTLSPQLQLIFSAVGAAEMRVTEGQTCAGAREPYVAGPRSFTVTGGEGWRYVAMQFFDAAGNATDCLVRSIFVDEVAPVFGSALEIQYGASATSSNVVNLTFNVSGATRMKVGERADLSDAAWQSYLPSITFVLSPGNGAKTVYARYADDAGNVIPSVGGPADLDSIKLDTSVPTAPSIFAAYDVTTQTSVLLLLSAGVMQDMILSQDDPGFTSGGWEPYTGSKVFALSGTDGAKTIYAKFKKSTGLETGVVSDTVILDRTAPILPSVQINGGAAVVTSNVVTLNLGAVDSASGLATYKVNTVNDFSAVSPKPFQPTDVFSFAPGDGLKTVWVTIGDRAGLYSTPVSATVVLDTTAPVAGVVAVTKLDGAPLATGGTVTDNRVLFTSTVSDLTPLEIQITTNGSFVGVAWIPYEASKLIDLTSGSPSISVRVRDGAGLVTNLVSAFTLTVDTAAPTLTLTRTSSAVASSLTVTLGLSANETSQAQVSESADFAGASWFATANTAVVLAAGDGLRTLYARARDTAGNLSTVQSVNVQVDTVNPTGSVVINQGAAATVTNVVTLGIAGIDTGSGVDGVRLADTLAGLASASIVPLEATKLWTLGGPAGSGVEEVKPVWLQVVDRAGLASAPVSDTIRFDRKNPSGSLTLAASVTNDTLVGVDLTYDADVTHVRLSAGNACAGGNWVEASTAMAVYLPSLDGLHDVSVRFRDGVMNESSCYTASVTLDRRGPVPSLLAITGSGAAGAGFSDSGTVTVDYATGEACAAAEFAEDAGFIAVLHSEAACAGTLPYSFALAGDGVKLLYLRFVDALGNMGPVTGQTVVVDSSPPAVSGAGFAVAEGAYVRAAGITLQMTAASASHMRVAQDTACTGGAETYAATRPLMLSGGEGAKTIAVSFTDEAGNATACYTRQVTLDTSAPGFTAALAGSEAIAGRTAQQVVTLTLSGVAADAVEMMVSDLPGFSGADWIPMQSSSLRVLPPGDGSKTVYVKLRDRAGNESVVRSPAIVLDQTPPDAVAIALTDMDDDGFVLEPGLVELGWSASADPNAVQFQLERFVLGADTTFQPVAALNVATVQYADDVTATAGAVHQYRVRVLDDLGRASQWSNVLGVYTMAADPGLCWSVDQTSGNSVAMRLTPPKGAVSVLPTYVRESLPLGATVTDSYPANQLGINLPADFSVVADGSIKLVSENQDGSSRVSSDFQLPYGFRRSSIAPGGYESAVLVGPDGTVHVGFYGASGDLIYMKNVGGVWSSPVALDTLNTTGRMPSIGLDPNGYVHISYYDWTTFDLRYVNNVGGTWNTPVSLDTAGDVGKDSALAVDASGIVHIAYWDSTTYYVKYVSNAGGWQPPVPLGTTGNVASPALVLDAAGNVHITYEGPTAKLMYMHNVGGLWSVPEEASPMGGRYSALMIDDLGFAHVAFQNPSAPYKIQFVDNTAGAWGVPVDIGTSGNAGWGLSMVYDNAGNGKAVWLDSAGFDLRYAISVTGTWGAPMILDGVGDMGEGNSISVDAFGNAHVTYYDRTNNMLRYAVEKQAGFTAPVAVQTGGIIGQHPSIAEAAGDLHVSYFNYTTKNLMYVKKSGGSWGAPATIDYTGLAPQLRFSQSSLAVDQNGDVHVSYFDITSEDLKYANNIGGAWNAPVVLDSTGTVGEQNSLSIDGNGDIHIAYSDGTNYAVKYVNNVGGGWSIPETVATNSYDPDLMADAAGDVHLVYRLGWPSADVMYLKRTGAAWDAPQAVDTLDTSVAAGFNTVLALDASNKVHIAYYSVDTSALKYVNDTGGAWSSPEVLDDAGVVGQEPAIRVGAAGVVHIGYYDATNGDLKYVRRSGGKWTAPAVLDSAGNVGEYPSLALDSRGDAHLAYFDHTTFDVKYKRIGVAEMGCAAPASSTPVGAF